MVHSESVLEYEPYTLHLIYCILFFLIRVDNMETINGFKVLGDIWVNEKNCYKCNALCKICNKNFETNYHSLHRMKSCGCARPNQLKPLPEFINGFKIIKCHGYNTIKKNGRWATVECKECHQEYDVDPNQLQYRKHCGCIKKDVIACRYAKSHPQLAQTIKHMIGRCYNKNNQDYYNYGARGITVCDEWLKNRNTFCEWSLKNGFENNKNLSIDRIDSNKCYSPDNCRWANAITQGRNTMRNVLDMEMARAIRKDAENMTQAQIAIKYNVSVSTVWWVVANRIWKE